MKKGLVFILGIITGVVLTILFSGIIAGWSGKTDISYYDEPGEVLSTRSLTVFQASPNGYSALVSQSGYGGPDDQLFYFYQTGKATPLYDGQLIKAPTGMIFRIVGTHSYNTHYGASTVPAITLMNRDENGIPKR